MRPECEKYHGRQLEVCEGTADLSADKINAFRVRWGLAPLPADEIQGRPSSLPPKVQLAVAKAKGLKIVRSRGARQINQAAVYRPGPKSQKSGGCGGCGGSRRVQPKLVPNGYGPGSQLLKLWTGMPHCDACLALAAQMDAWGIEGCTQRLGQVVADILPRAQAWLKQRHPWAKRLLVATATEGTILRLGIARDVRRAIEAASEYEPLPMNAEGDQP